MASRKRATRTVPAKPALGSLAKQGTLSISVIAPKPRNAALQAAALGQVKLGTAKHEKSKGALRRAEKMALNKAALKNDS